MSKSSRRLLAAAGLSLCAAFLYFPFLSASLDDFDSYNFARALFEFAPARFQPHPPGYVWYVWLGRLTLAITGDPHIALTTLSALCGALVCGMLFLSTTALLSSRVALTTV
ncbi:MAG: DUF2723 domain-containing protein, partial [Anaerolineae bacterium]|nr:DUF2723 domain-containing protein [Thermoflexales bacterium]MDW8408671.1 DUF2723 domain-containing protein [Anaerolineae bacterium]